MKVAINGFGRIGKLVFRAFLERKIKEVDIVAINELGSLESSFHLLKFDSTHGRLFHKISMTKNSLKYSNKIIVTNICCPVMIFNGIFIKISAHIFTFDTYILHILLQ